MLLKVPRKIPKFINHQFWAQKEVLWTKYSRYAQNSGRFRLSRSDYIYKSCLIQLVTLSVDRNWWVSLAKSILGLCHSRVRAHAYVRVCNWHCFLMTHQTPSALYKHIYFKYIYKTGLIVIPSPIYKTLSPYVKANAKGINSLWSMPDRIIYSTERALARPRLVQSLQRNPRMARPRPCLYHISAYTIMLCIGHATAFLV